MKPQNRDTASSDQPKKQKTAAYFSSLNRERLRSFKKLKRSWYSFIFLSLVFVLSLFSEMVSSDKPWLIFYEGKIYSPVLFFYPETQFGGQQKTEADYLELSQNPEFQKKAWTLFALLKWGPYRSHLELEGSPPFSPRLEHPLGTDESGRDILSRLLYGFRICFLFALILTFLNLFWGISIGGIQGYLGGRVDLWGQRLIEIWSSLPFLYVVMLLGSLYGQNFAVLLLIMMLFNWVGVSYFMRAEFIRLKNLNYIKAARVVGFSKTWIFWHEILPNALTPVITMIPFQIVGAISTLTALDFLGFGLQAPTPSWGALLQEGLRNLQAPWIAFSATAALLGTLILASFVGEGLRDAFDPKTEYEIE